MASGDKNLQRLYATMSKSEEYQYWYDKNIELIDKYQPDFMWHDMGLPGIPDSWKQRYLAYYYNKAMDWGKEVVVSYKIYDPNSFGNGAGEIADYERGGPTNLASPYWMTDDSISKETWAYSKGMTYYSTKSVLHALIDKVSKNGNLLLNCAPMADAYEIKENFPLILKERKIMTTTTYNKTAVPLSGFLVATGLLVASAIALAGDAYPSVPIPDFKFADGPFKPDWDSLAKYRCPE